MSEFPKFSQSDYPILYLEQTDKDLVKTLDPNLRYAYFKTIAKGGKSLIRSFKDMHLGSLVCYNLFLHAFSDRSFQQDRLMPASSL